MLYLKKYDTHSGYVSGKTSISKPYVASCVSDDDCHFSEAFVHDNGHEYVDLDLASGMLWAKCNVGASSESDYGGWFQFGQTELRSDYENSYWSTAPFNGGSSSYDSAYFSAHMDEFLDGGVLRPEYDAAAVNMGGDWRMPTVTEFNELYNGTDRQWVTDFNGSGKNGMKFTSKKDSSKYIFIPAAGFIWHKTEYKFNEECYVRTSMIKDGDFQNALRFNIRSTSVTNGGTNRDYCLSVRGVMPVSEQ